LAELLSKLLPFVLPKGTPAAVVQKLHNVSVAAMSVHATEERPKELVPFWLRLSVGNRNIFKNSFKAR
jgi:hypothetical protein